MLVSTQLISPKMEIYDSNKALISLKSQNKTKNNRSLSKDIVLCHHCKRTPSNGIRCLGMCVADNDY